MKIIDIHIYGYGKLEDFTLSNLKDLQVIYGENEAGKSTIMSFIHSILFGFPTKQQSELRYEPKKGAKYGGKLTVYFPDKGKVIIERVKGKATGDVRVLLADGTIGSEELLAELLHHVDKSVFQSIFSFNLQGLQNIQQLKSEDLGKFLFSAGALGTDQLLQTENALQKELDNRFKPNGKKPTINEKLKNLKQLYQELKEAEQKNEQYGVQLQKRAVLEEEIKSKQQTQSNKQNQLARCEAWKQIQPLLQEEADLHEELHQFTEASFPVDGMRRMERLEGMMKPIEGQLSSLEKRISIMKAEIAENSPNPLLLDNEQEITVATESISLIEKLQQEEIEMASKLSEIKQNEAVLREKLHLSMKEEELLAINTSIFIKEKVLNYDEKYRRLTNKKIDLDESFQEEKTQLEEIETKINHYRRQLLPESERANLMEKVSKAENKSVIEREIEETEEKLKYLSLKLNKEKEKAKKKRATDRLQLILFSTIFILLFIWGIWKQEWLFMAVGTISFLIVLRLFWKDSSSVNHEFIKEEIRALEKQRQQMIEKLRSGDFQTISAIQAQLENDRQFTDQLNFYQIQWQQKNDQYEKVISAFEKWEEEISHLKQEMQIMGEQLQLPKELSLVHLADAFQLIEQLKGLYREKQLMREKKAAVANRIDKLIETIHHLCMECFGASLPTVQEGAYSLKKSLKEEQEKQIKFKEKNSKLLELEEDYQKLLLEYKHYETERTNLLQLAKVDSVENYKELGLSAEKKLNLTEQLKHIKRQINRSSFSEEELVEFKRINHIEHLILAEMDKLAELKKEIPILQAELAKIKYEIQILEEGGIYSELLHKYKQLEAEFAEEAREWAKFAAAKNILERTIESFKKERLPQMLEKAEEFLGFLTAGNYIRIYPKKEGSGFLIENKEHLLFEANELSQATAEQIYVSLRFALAVTIYEKYTFPIIMDDSFVNFDKNRTIRIIELMQNISGRQVLFLTCHEHLLSSFNKEQVHLLGKKIPLSI